MSPQFTAIQKLLLEKVFSVNSTLTRSSFQFQSWKLIFRLFTFGLPTYRFCHIIICTIVHVPCTHATCDIKANREFIVYLGPRNFPHGSIILL